MEHKTISLADQVFERLETDILSGKYQKGEVFTEMKLTAELGVSRTPVREALRRLEAEHIVEDTPRGMMVVGIGKQDLIDIYTIREAIEGICVRKVVDCITDEQLAELREAVELQEFYVTKRDPDHIKSMDSRFHELLYKFSGSVIFYDVLMPLHKKAQKYRKVSVENKSRAEESLREHRDIYEAIAARDADRAQALLSLHVRNAGESILKREI